MKPARGAHDDDLAADDLGLAVLGYAVQILDGRRSSPGHAADPTIVLTDDVRTFCHIDPIS
jgi:hypothetical protein